MHIEKEDASRQERADELISAIYVHSPDPDSAHSAEKSFSKLMARIQSDNTLHLFERRTRRYGAWLAVASVALLLSIGGWIYSSLGASPELIVKSNYMGVVQDVQLVDGTTVKLNHRSRIIYPERFSAHCREVFLEGEAYFDVAHNDDLPFIVHAGNLKIKVLGTKFSINASATLPQITALLLEGSIEVSSEKEQLLMKPNQLLTYDVSSEKMQLESLSHAKQQIDWTQNVWRLSGTSLLDICERLESLFDVTFIIMDSSLIDKSFTGEFYTNESLESILKTMQISTSFTYERRGKHVLLR